MRHCDSKDNYEFWKRIFDIVISGGALVVLFPLFMIVTIVLKFEDPKEKVIFCQDRIGRNGNTFSILKFRSMKEETPDYVPAKELYDPTEFVTRVGKLLRGSSIDELPQLVNVLRGEMSIVGPRPLIKEEGDIHKKRMDAGVYEIRPGMTGLAQIHGGNLISDQEKLAWDICYLEHRNVFLDLKICIRTFGSIKGNWTKSEGTAWKGKEESER